MSDKNTREFSRRQALLGSSALAMGLPLMGAASLASSQAGAEETGDMPKLFDPDYARKPLRSDSIKYMIIQSPDIAIDPKNAQKERRQNLNRMLDLLNKAPTDFSGSPDLISFHEMPLHGFGEWERSEMLKVAIEVPGVETEALGKKAKELNCYISFGSYVVDKDWPDHVIMMGVLIGPDGKVAARHWKARGSLTGFGLYASTVNECLERYVEMYGWDEVIPVARTDIGNICLSGVQYDPTLFTAMALKGAELVLRYATGGVPIEEAKTMSRCNRFYTGYANSSVYTDHRYYPGGVGTGGSAIIDPSGKVLGQADRDQGVVRATIPMASFRASHKVPSPQWDLYAPIFDQFKPRFDPGWFLKHLPKSWADTRAFFKDKGNW